MKKIILFFTLLLLTGCSDYVEINELAVATGMALDYKNNEFTVTLQIIDQQSKEAQNKMILFEANAESIDKAIGKISKLANKKIFISHLKAIIISPEIIKKQINYQDYFIRDPKSKMNFFVYTTNDLNPKDILESQTNSEVSSMYLDSLLSFNEDVYSSSVELKFFNLLLESLDQGKNVVYPVITFKDKEKKKDIILENLITYNYKNKKLTLNEKESITYNILTNNAKETIIDINCDNKKFSLSLDDIKTKFSWKNNTFNIDTTLGGSLGSYECEKPLTDKDAEKYINDLAYKTLQDNINNLIKKAKENENDFLGIGNHIYKFDYSYFNFKKNNWDQKLKDIDIKTKLTLNIISKGEARFNMEGEKQWKSKLIVLA